VEVGAGYLDMRHTTVRALRAIGVRQQSRHGGSLRSVGYLRKASQQVTIGLYACHGTSGRCHRIVPGMLSLHRNVDQYDGLVCLLLHVSHVQC
jgi:hypothetical protein